MLNQGGRSFSGNERHCVFLNTGNDPRATNRFANISAITGLDFPDDGRAIGIVDWDQDGDQDMWLSNRNAPRLRFMRNESGTDKNYLTIRLVGNGTTTNRDAIGARIEVLLEDADPKASIPSPGDPPQLIRSLRAGEGFLSQSSKWIHFGLGNVDKIKNVVVHWPGGKVETFSDLKVNRRYELAQGSAAARDITTPARNLQLSASVPKGQPATANMRVPLVALLRMPDLNYRDFSGQPQSLKTPPGGPVLINLWSTTCKPCLEELNQFTKRAEEIRKAGIRIVALSVDGLEQDQAAKPAEEMLSSMGFPFDAGEATKETIQTLYSMKKSLLFSAQKLPLPASFLIDAAGHLTVLYLGPVSVDSLLNDLNHSSRTLADRYQHSAARHGRVLKHDVTDKIMEKNEALAFFNFSESLRKRGLQDDANLQFEELAKFQYTSPNARRLLAEMFFEWSNLLVEQGKWQEAVDAVGKAIDKSPENAKYHYNLGVIRGRLGDLETAQQHYRDALGIQPDLTSARSNLARSLAKEKKWDEAATHFREVILARPNHAETLYNLGVALAKQEKWREAATQFRTALEVRPKFSQARRYLELTENKLNQDPN